MTDKPTPGNAAPMTFLSLFAGIGGIDLGLDRAGMTCVGQVEIDPYCRRVLAKHWPEVPQHDDVRTAVEWWGNRPSPDVICGGFPCQPISFAGEGRAQADDRWLWPAMWAVVRALRPRYVLMENVAAIRHRGLGDILGDLATGGYDSEWDCLPAAAFGAPHRRDRWVCVAWDADVAHADRKGPQGRTGETSGRPGATRRLEPERLGNRLAWQRPPPRGDWASEPDVGRVAHGVPARVDRLRGLGNAVVPQVAEYVGRLIVNHEGAAA